jgi:NAD(P)-dependent dehydrogenase (short-subunit alcohol dehydrogenase family)
LSQQLIPLMRLNKYGRIVNLSSGMGQLSDMNSGCPSYRLSKTALNALTKTLAEELKVQGENILVNSMCPGWVKTDMGGPGSMRELSEGTDTAIYLATLPDGGPTGTFFRDRKPFAW